MRNGRRGARGAQRGFVLIAWMVTAALLAAIAMMAITRLADELAREREDLLLQMGDEIAGAIAAYRAASAGSNKTFPPQLEDLLEDRRAFGTVRYLRRLQHDPITRGAWGLVRAVDGGVMGVYSASNAAPLKRVASALDHVDLPAATHYTQWRFVAREVLRAPGAGPHPARALVDRSNVAETSVFKREGSR